MKLSPAGLQRLKGYEGCKLTMYLDSAGLPTIGVGHLLTPDERISHRFQVGITEEQADALLAADVAPCEEVVSECVTVPLTQDQYDSLVSFAFNLGCGALKGSSLLAAINRGAPPAEIRADFLKWDKRRDPRSSVLVEDDGLKRRRADEAKYWPDPPPIPTT